jgi:chemotaxis signal transduction protein
MTSAKMTHGLPLASAPLSPPLLLELPPAVLRRRDDEIDALAGRGLPRAISAEDIRVVRAHGIELILFEAGGNRYAVAAAEVQRVSRLAGDAFEETEPGVRPMQVDLVRSLTGRPVERTPESRLLVCVQDGGAHEVAVDAVHTLFHSPATAIHPMPGFIARGTTLPYVWGFAEAPDAQLVALLELRHLLARHAGTQGPGSESSLKER